MSFLYPLLLAGLAAVGLPILLHMIRRHTRERVTFSSLMFLRTTLPRFRHRSRIEHWLLLCVRCLIVCLLAIAFARPFLRQPLPAGPRQPGKRIVVLLDTSASMRRAGLWDQALREARSVLSAAGPADRVCVMTFDRTTRTIVGFDQWQTAAGTNGLSTLAPGWAATNLGQALVAAAEAIGDDEANDRDSARVHQVLLISDLQQGSDLEALAAYEWPKNITLSVRPLVAQGKTNAAMQLVTGRDYLSRLDDINAPTIRVTNSAEAMTQRFRLHWADATGDSTDVYVPAGGSAVVKPPPRPEANDHSPLQLAGDDQDFDNALYVTPPLQQPINVLYIGNDDPNDPKGQLFYLRQAFGAAGALNARVIQCRSDQPWPAAQADRAQLVAATGPMDATRVETLQHALAPGRTGLFILKSDEAPVRDKYAMLARMELTHPLLAPFADPKFGDFTRVHFWKYVRVRAEDIAGARVLAWFDTNDPAILEIPSGRGSLLVFTFGWNPADSDLALSSKFVPLLYSILEYGGILTEQRPQYVVGDPVPLPAWAASELADVRVRKPDNSLVRPDSVAFTATDVPGIYTIEAPKQSQPFAVNLAASECRTDPMPLEDLEKLGLPVAGLATDNQKMAAKGKQAADFVAMESHQKLWRWVIVAVLGMVFFETWLAERVRASSKPVPTEHGYDRTSTV
jgi:hypothetical protein